MTTAVAAAATAIAGTTSPKLLFSLASVASVVESNRLLTDVSGLISGLISGLSTKALTSDDVALETSSDIPEDSGKRKN